MEINVIKKHAHYSFGFHEVSEERGKYLISMGVAELVEGFEYPETPKNEIEPDKEKVEFTPVREKRAYKKRK